MPARLYRQKGVLKAEIARAGRSVGFALRTASLLAIMVYAILLNGRSITAVEAQGIRPNDEIIADPVTGAALLGFDPVAYFIDNQAIPGNRNRQATFAGKVWYFASNANKTAFETSPATYLPAFGGHDPVAIAAGFALSGSPEFFAIEKDRVFLFRNAESRDAFLRDPRIGAAAQSHWPQVKRDMVP
jgi:YHS domain-containing protein